MTKSLNAQSCATPNNKQETTTGRIQRLRKPMFRLSLARRSPTTDDWFACGRQVQSQGVFRLQSAVATGVGAKRAVVAAGDGAARQVPHWLARAAGDSAAPAI